MLRVSIALKWIYRCWNTTRETIKERKGLGGLWEDLHFASVSVKCQKRPIIICLHAFQQHPCASLRALKS